jgi:hypothetical protein
VIACVYDPALYSSSALVKTLEALPRKPSTMKSTSKIVSTISPPVPKSISGESQRRCTFFLTKPFFPFFVSGAAVASIAPASGSSGAAKGSSGAGGVGGEALLALRERFPAGGGLSWKSAASCKIFVGSSAITVSDIGGGAGFFGFASAACTLRYSAMNRSR